MRVTNNTVSGTLIDQLNRLGLRQRTLQGQAATGQRVTMPEDDPAAFRRALDLQDEGQRVAQYQQNITGERELAQATFTAMKSLKNVSDRAGEISTQADSLRSPQELHVFANEITQLIKTAVDVANTKFKGDYLFAGTKSDSPAYVLTTDASGTVTGVTYQGNATVPEHEISEGETISSQVPGANTTGSGPQGLITDSRSGADFFNHLIALQNHLLAGDTASVAATDRAALGKDEDNFVFQLGTNGAVQSRLETQTALLGQRKQSVATLTSNEVDADLATTLVQLNQSQNAYQVALQSGAQLFRQSLLDFLR